MRKQNLFGKKIRNVNIFILILIILVFELAGYFLIVNLQQAKMNALKDDQIDLTLEINQALSSNDPTDYLQISEMINELPTDVTEFAITGELQFVKFFTGISDDLLFDIDYSFDVSSPFDHPLASTLHFVSISLTMEIDDSSLALDFYENLMAQERLYYVSSFETILYTDESARVEMTIYTFYNDIEI